jgi:hypothetical protein
VAVDGGGNVYVADSFNNEVKEMPAGCASASCVTTLGGSFSGPSGVAVDGGGNVYVADTSDNAVKEIALKAVHFSTEPVGTPSGVITLTFTFDSGGSIGAPAALTMGASGLDFADQGAGSCTTNGSSYGYSTGDTCTVDVTFTPKYPGQRMGAVELVDTSAAKSVIATARVYGEGTGPQAVFSPSTTAALGGGFSQPYGVAVDGGGNVYVADSFNNEVREMPAGCASASCVTTLGGGFSLPLGVAVDGGGNVYVADTYNNAVKEMPAGCTSASCVTTLGGGFSYPYGVAVDGSGNIYVADTLNNALKEMPAGCASASCVTTLGGGFIAPSGVAVDGSGNVYVADSFNREVKEMPAGCASASCVRTLGGSGFSEPQGVAVDGGGNVYVADSFNNEVKEMPAGCASASCVTTLGGGFSGPSGVAVDGGGNVYVADTGNNAVKEINRATPPSLSFPTATAVNTTDSTDGVRTATVKNIGNDTLTFPVPTTQGAYDPSVSANFAYVDAASTCTQTGSSSSEAFTLAAGASCTMGVEFTPTAAGSINGSITLTDNALNQTYAQQQIGLSGTGTLSGASLSTGALPFGSVALGFTSAAKTVTLTSTGSGTLASIVVSTVGTYAGDFTPTTQCPSRLAPGKKCTISVTFSPTVVGPESATLQVSDNAATSPQTVALSGTGLADVTLTPASISFGNVATGTASNAKNFTLHNNELTALSISSITFTGANAGDFAQTNTCGTLPTSLAAGSSCTISVTLTPSATGAESATLTVNDNAAAPYNTVTSALSGTGVADVTLTPASYSFGNVPTGTASSAKNFTLHNNELTALSISSIGFTGTNAGDFSQTNTCGALPTSLAAGTSCTISVTLTPSVLGAETATLTVNDNAPVAQYQTLTSSLSGAGVADATLTPASASFGSVATVTASNAKNFTLHNNELTALSISSITFTGTNASDFSQTNTCGTLPTSLAAGTSCTISVTLTPSLLGAETATLKVNDNAAVAQYQTLTSSLSGTSVADVTLTPASASFGNVATGTASNAKNFTLHNNELTALSVSSITFTGTNAGDFSQTNTCGTLPTSLAAGTSCTISVTLTPGLLGAETATLKVNDNAAVAQYQTLTSSLSGRGVADVTLSPASASFGSLATGTASNAKNFTLHNNELTALSVSSITFTGTNAGDFSQTNTCGALPTSLAAGTSCTISVTLTPSVLGAETATLTVTDNAPVAQYQTLTSSLSGTGVADVTLAPASASFGSVATVTASNAKNFTLHNNELTALSISRITFTGTNAGDFSQTNTCGALPANLAAGTSCTISVTLTPSVLGAETATLTVNDNAAVAQYQTLTSSLSGTGVTQAIVSPTSLTFSKQTVGTTSAAKNVTLKSNLLTTLTISSVGFTGANPRDFAQTNTCGGSLLAQSTCTITVTFKPTAKGTRTAALSVNDSANNSPQTVSLAGTGE